MAEENVYEENLREKILQMDKNLDAIERIMFSPKPKSYADIDEPQVEVGVVELFGGTNRIVALAEEYQRNFENPRINKILKKRKKYLTSRQEALVELLKEDLHRNKEAEYQRNAEGWLRELRS